MRSTFVLTSTQTFSNRIIARTGTQVVNQQDWRSKIGRFAKLSIHFWLSREIWKGYEIMGAIIFISFFHHKIDYKKRIYLEIFQMGWVFREVFQNVQFMKLQAVPQKFLLRQSGCILRVYHCYKSIFFEKIHNFQTIKNAIHKLWMRHVGCAKKAWGENQCHVM